MKIFKFNEREIRVPERLNEITVKELIHIHSMGEFTGSVNDIARILEVFNGKIDISQLPLDRLIEISAILGVSLFSNNSIPEEVDSFTFAGQTYHCLAPEELLVREFIDFQEMSKEPVANLPLLLAIICQYDEEEVPDDNYIDYIYAKRDLFMNLDSETAQGCLLFFSKSFTDYVVGTLESMETTPELRQKITELVKEMKG